LPASKKAAQLGWAAFLVFSRFVSKKFYLPGIAPEFFSLSLFSSGSHEKYYPDKP
jgi:hypothetical protein